MLGRKKTPRHALPRRKNSKAATFPRPRRICMLAMATMLFGLPRVMLAVTRNALMTYSSKLNTAKRFHASENGGVGISWADNFLHR